YLPPEDREGFVFHATDIFHGSRYFDRRNPKWPEETRFAILTDLAKVIEDLMLPLVVGAYREDTFGLSAGVSVSDKLRRILIQTAAAMDCAIWTDRWLATYAPDENAMIIAEDSDHMKRMVKTVFKVLRTPALIQEWGLASFA